MPKWRKLHTKITESVDFNELPDDQCRLLWVMLPLALDREGRCLDHPNLIKSKTMPMRDDVSAEAINSALAAFEERRMIARYEVNGRHYIWVPTFELYQGNTSREAESNHPAPPPELVQSYSRATHELVASRSSTDSDADSDADVDAAADASAVAAANALARSGIGFPKADELVGEHGPQYVTQKIRYYQFAVRLGLVNRIGWLVKAIEDDYGPPPGYQERPSQDYWRELAEQLEAGELSLTEEYLP